MLREVLQAIELHLLHVGKRTTPMVICESGSRQAWRSSARWVQHSAGAGFSRRSLALRVLSLRSPPSARITASVEPPGGHGQIKRIGRDGNDWPWPKVGHALAVEETRAACTKRRRVRSGIGNDDLLIAFNLRAAAAAGHEGKPRGTSHTSSSDRDHMSSDCPRECPTNSGPHDGLSSCIRFSIPIMLANSTAGVASANTAAITAAATTCVA